MRARNLGGCPMTATTPTTASSVAPTAPTLLGPEGRSTNERGRRRGGGRWRGSDECARCVEASGELLQGEGTTDLQEGGCRLLVRERRLHGLVAAGKAAQNVEDQNVLRDRVPEVAKPISRALHLPAVVFHG
jgi:hypothetical protein